MSFRLRAVLATGLVALLTVVSWHFLLDDSLIYYRYIRNALNGASLVFNAGERVNALTSPLYTYVLLGTSWLFGGHVHLAASALFFLMFSGTCVMAEWLFPYAGLLLASMSYFYSLVGMETSLLLFLIMLSLTLYRAERRNWLPLVLVLMFLTRFEAGAFLPSFAYQPTARRSGPRGAQSL